MEQQAEIWCYAIGAMGLFFAFVFCAWLYVVGQSVRQWRDQHRPVWESFAKELNGNCRQVSRWHPKVVVTVPLSSWTAELSAPADSSDGQTTGRESRSTRLLVSLPDVQGVGFLVYSREPGARVTLAGARLLRSLPFAWPAALDGSSVAAPEVLLGHPEFDRDFILATDEPAAARHILGDPRVLERLWSSGQPVPTGIFSRPGEPSSGRQAVLCCEMAGIVADTFRLKAMHSLTLCLAEQLSTVTVGASKAG